MANKLVDYYREYAPSRFRLPNGEPVKKRSQQLIAKRYQLPVIRIGHSCLIDPEAADERLRELAVGQESFIPKRGRPRRVV